MDSFLQDNTDVFTMITMYVPYQTLKDTSLVNKSFSSAVNAVVVRPEYWENRIRFQLNIYQPYNTDWKKFQNSFSLYDGHIDPLPPMYDYCLVHNFPQQMGFILLCDFIIPSREDLERTLWREDCEQLSVVVISCSKFDTDEFGSEHMAQICQSKWFKTIDALLERCPYDHKIWKNDMMLPIWYFLNDNDSESLEKCLNDEKHGANAATVEKMVEFSVHNESHNCLRMMGRHPITRNTVKECRLYLDGGLLGYDINEDGTLI